MKLLLLITASLASAPSYAMLSNTHPAYYHTTCPVSANSTERIHHAALPHALTGQTDTTVCLAQSAEAPTLTRAEIEALPINIRAAIIRDTVLKAVDEGDTTTVLSDFSSWINFVMPREYYQAAVGYTLLHAAQQSPKKTTAIIEDLLTRVDLKNLIEPDALVRAAMDNHHILILKEMQKAEPGRMAATLATEIVRGNPNRVQALLRAGVQPVNNPGLKLPFVLLQVALDAFIVPEKQPLVGSRLAIIDLLVKHTEIGAIPASHTFNMSKVPVELQQEIIERLKTRQASTRTASIKVPDAQETPLHTAAKNKDYAQCFAYLTKWSGPLNKQELLPLHALLVLNFAHNDQKAQQNAGKEFSEFPVNFQKLMETRLKISKDQLLAQDSLGRTPQQVAQAHGASQELIELLDPKNHKDVQSVLISSDIKKITGKRVIIPIDAERIAVLAKLDPKNDQATIEAVTSTHAQLTGLLKQYEASSSKKIKNQLMQTHQEFLGLIDKLENTDDRGVSDTIILDLKKRTDLEKTNLKVTLRPKPVNDSTGPAHKIGDFFIENGEIYKVGAIEKAK